MYFHIFMEIWNISLYHAWFNSYLLILAIDYLSLRTFAQREATAELQLLYCVTYRRPKDVQVGKIKRYFNRNKDDATENIVSMYQKSM